MTLPSQWVDLFFLGTVGFLVLLFFLKNRGPDIQKTPFQERMVGYRLIYADQKDCVQTEGKQKLLFSSKYNLQGKPDYIYQKRWGKGLLPLEEKSGKIGENEFPHPGDLMQLTAYFLLIEETYHSRPAKGYLRYRDGMFCVKNTAKRRREAIRTMEEMRKMLKTGKGEPNPSFVHCRYCLCNGTVCEFCENR